MEKQTQTDVCKHPCPYTCIHIHTHTHIHTDTHTCMHTPMHNMMIKSINVEETTTSIKNPDEKSPNYDILQLRKAKNGLRSNING